MAKLIEFDTARLRLRQWCAEDREPFAVLNADSKVMEFFPALLNRSESDAMANRLKIDAAFNQELLRLLEMFDGHIYDDIIAKSKSV